MQLHHWFAFALALAPSLASAALFPKDSLVKQLDAKAFKKVMKDNVRHQLTTHPCSIGVRVASIRPCCPPCWIRATFLVTRVPFTASCCIVTDYSRGRQRPWSPSWHLGVG